MCNHITFRTHLNHPSFSSFTGKEIISAVGAEVDRIESDIMTLVPGVRYVDLETDRGSMGGRGLVFTRGV